MRYQTFRYEIGRGSRPAEIIEAADRPEALGIARAIHGSNSAGVEALDAECSYCEDSPAINAASWTDPEAPLYAPCPRCGKTHHPE